ncbi:uncharacterized protein EV154DRAFT_124218 [Mucor mucedo]|uniref:uncharacterized protein n=1 Tax=Mucor mucedo TaxID=29922 RepID=UPI00221F7953|nr:uncharacterized protein EV154DRAFT_124218 [Mucor mucedo]KAI7893836.1 hypothetical protein EV154DRAFT_124218 [Mucor mucedo]
MSGQNTGVNLNEFPALDSMSNFNTRQKKSYASTVQESLDRPSAEDFPGLPNNNVGSESLHDSSRDSNDTTHFIAKNSGQWSRNTNKPEVKYGLLGLLDMIREIDPDRRTMSIGYDVDRLGLGLDRSYSIYSTFISPWTENNQNASVYNIEQGYYIPTSYRMLKIMPPIQERIKSFSDEILFYEFYSKPKDNIQELVAKELYERHWRFNKSLCLWMTKEIDEHGRPKKPLQYLPEENTFDQNTFTVFDPFKWKKIKKELSIVRNTIEIKF